MIERTKYAAHVIIAVFLFLLLVFGFIIWVPVWIITGNSFPQTVEDYMEKHVG